MYGSNPARMNNEAVPSSSFVEEEVAVVIAGSWGSFLELVFSGFFRVWANGELGWLKLVMGLWAQGFFRFSSHWINVIDLRRISFLTRPKLLMPA